MNILVFNGKGGASKSTNSNIVASNIKDSLLIEIDKINETQSDISGDFEVKQIDFNHENQQSYLDFENLLLEDKNTIIDIGASKIDIFHTCMTKSNLYDLIDLLIIPAMDGYDDFNTALNLLTTLDGVIPSNKILFSFNRFNEHEYSTVKEQFDNFFNNQELIKNTFSIDLEDEQNYYILKDSRAIKYARNSGLSIKELADKDLEDITKRQRAEKDKAKRLELTKQKSLITQAQNFHNNYVIPMMERINKKLTVKGEIK
jgi:hypothetical protein